MPQTWTCVIVQTVVMGTCWMTLYAWVPCQEITTVSIKILKGYPGLLGTWWTLGKRGPRTLHYKKKREIGTTQIKPVIAKACTCCKAECFHASSLRSPFLGAKEMGPFSWEAVKGTGLVESICPENETHPHEQRHPEEATTAASLKVNWPLYIPFFLECSLSLSVSCPQDLRLRVWVWDVSYPQGRNELR